MKYVDTFDEAMLATVIMVACMIVGFIVGYVTGKGVNNAKTHKSKKSGKPKESKGCTEGET